MTSSYQELTAVIIVSGCDPPQQPAVPLPSETATNLMLEHLAALAKVHLQPLVKELPAQAFPRVVSVHFFELSQ